jgi:hypothetical protein
MGITSFTRHTPTTTTFTSTKAPSSTSSGTTSKWGGRSDFSRPSITSSSSTTLVIEEPVEEEEKISQPRFSVFGKKAKFTSINQKSLEQDTTAIQEKKKAKPTATTGISILGAVERLKPQQPDIPTTEPTQPKRRIRAAPKFEMHLSTKSAANHKEEQEKQEIEEKSHQEEIDHLFSPTKKTVPPTKGVKFHPIFLEQVALFRESEPSNELADAHNKQPKFRIICLNSWPPVETNDYHEKNILVTKKSFFVTEENTQIKGKIMIRNLALDKSVSIRYTFDTWTTVRDVDGVFFGPNPKNIAFDIYEFAMSLDELSDRGELRGKIEFAIRFTAGQDDYWDNNEGRNYQIKVIADPLNDPWKNERVENEDKAEEQQEEEGYYEEDEDEVEEEEEEKHSSFTNALKGYKHAKPFHLNKRQPWLGTRYDFGQSLQLAKRAPYESWSATVKADPTLITDYFLVKPISIKPTSPPPSVTAVAKKPPTPSSSLTTATTTKPASSLAVSFSNYPKVSEPPIVTAKPTTTNITKPLSYARSFSSASIISSPKKPTLSSTTTTTIPPPNSSSAPPSPRTSPTLTNVSLLPVPVPVRPTLQHSYTSPNVIPNSPLDIGSSYYLDLVNKYCFYNGAADQHDDSLLPIS